MPPDGYPDTRRTIVRTERLLMRPICAADRDAFLEMEHVSRDHFRPWMPLGPGTMTDNEFFQITLRFSHEWEEDGRRCRRVAMLDDGQMAGVFTLDQIFRGPFLNAVAGWRVSAACIGKGIATEAMQAMLDLAFARESCALSLHRVEANIIPRNKASIRVAEKLGMTREGLSPKYLQIAGTWEDHARFAITRENHTPVYTPEQLPD